DLLPRCLNDHACWRRQSGTIGEQDQIGREKNRKDDEYPRVPAGIVVLPKDEIGVDRNRNQKGPKRPKNELNVNTQIQIGRSERDARKANARRDTDDRSNEAQPSARSIRLEEFTEGNEEGRHSDPDHGLCDEEKEQ